MGVGVPILFLIVFGLIGRLSPGNFSNSGYTVLDLYVPTIMVITFIFLGITSLPVTLVRYREMGWLRRISTTPVPPSRILAAQLVLNLVLALASILTVIFGSELIFGSPLSVSVPYFILSIILAIAVMFSLGLAVAAVAPSQTIANVLTGLLTFLMLFLSGLVPPALLGGPLATIMNYSPAGAAVQAVLYSVFNVPPPAMTLVAMATYTGIFAFIATRYFRWQ